MELKNLKKNPKKNKGISEVAAATLLATFFLLTIYFVCIMGLKPFFIHLTLQSIDRQAGLRMEADGGLSNQTRTYIIDSLEKMPGFDQNKLTIDSSNDDSNPANYGDSMYLNLTYSYESTEFKFKGLSVVKYKGSPKPISAHWVTTSKKIIVVDH